jgi:hypothetical protein
MTVSAPTSAQHSSTQTTRRAAAVGLAAFTGLTGAGWLVWASGGVPSWGAAPATTAHWYVEHVDAARTGALLGTLGLLGFVLFISAMHEVLAAAEGESKLWTRVATTGGILTAVVHFAFLTFLFAAALRPGVVDASTTATMHDLFLITAGTAPPFYIAMIGGVALVILRTGVFSRAAGWACAVIAITQLCPLGVPYDHGGLFDPGRGLLGVFVPFGGLFVWAVLMVHQLWASSSPQPAPNAPSDLWLSE